MGEEHFVAGRVEGENLLQQLLDLGFYQEDDKKDLRCPLGHRTGMIVGDRNQLEGYDAWETNCYGFGALLQALRQVQGLENAVLYFQLDDPLEHSEGYLYKNGTWHTMIVIEQFVREDQIQEAIEAVDAALAPFGPQGETV